MGPRRAIINCANCQEEAAVCAEGEIEAWATPGYVFTYLKIIMVVNPRCESWTAASLSFLRNCSRKSSPLYTLVRVSWYWGQLGQGSPIHCPRWAKGSVSRAFAASQRYPIRSTKSYTTRKLCTFLFNEMQRLGAPQAGESAPPPTGERLKVTRRWKWCWCCLQCDGGSCKN